MLDMKHGCLRTVPAERTLWRVKSSTSQHVIYPLRRGNSLRRGIHDFRPAIRAIATDENLRMVLGPRELGPRPLSDRDDHHVARNRLAAAVRPNLESRDPS